MDIITYALLNKKIEQGGGTEELERRISTLEHDKVDLATYATGEKGLTQADALTILTYPETYEGKIIQFYSNTTEPAHLISYGFILRDTTPEHNLCLIEFDRNGHTIKWNENTNYNANEGITFREIK